MTDNQKPEQKARNPKPRSRQVFGFHCPETLPDWLAEALRQSILKKAFSGQLIPQDENDEPAAVLLERIRATRLPASDKKATSSTAGVTR